MHTMLYIAGDIQRIKKTPQPGRFLSWEVAAVSDPGQPAGVQLSH